MLGEGGRQQAQGGRGQDGAPDALSGPGGDQLRSSLGEPAEEAEEGKGRQSDDEDAAPAKHVSGAAAEHQEAGEGQRVGVDDPLLAGIRHVEPGAHLRQRDIDDRDVEDDHELGDAGDREDRAARQPGSLTFTAMCGLVQR